MQIRFFQPRDFKGWGKRVLWRVVAAMQGRYVHCEAEVNGVVVNADHRMGVEIKPPSDMTPSAVLYVSHDPTRYHDAVQAVMGHSYSWGGLFSLCLPKWGGDPKGMICSEFVAYLLASSAVSCRHRWPFVAVPPYRWTPNAIYLALTRLDTDLLTNPVSDKNCHCSYEKPPLTIS